MRLSSTRGEYVWEFPVTPPETKPARVVYHRATSLDVEVAQTMAAKYGASVLAGEPILADFGLMPESLDSVIESLSRGHDDVRGFATRFYAVALAERLFKSIENFDLDGVPAALGRAFIAALLGDPVTQNKWLKLAEQPLHDQALAGNVSAPALNISSAGAKKTAAIAKPSAPPAPSAD